MGQAEGHAPYQVLHTLQVTVIARHVPTPDLTVYHASLHISARDLECPCLIVPLH